MNYLLWQLADSGFPSGGFAHSGGLEAAMQHGHVSGGADLYPFAHQAVVQAGRGGLPLLTAAHRDAGALPELDALADAFLSNPVANRASRAQGRAFLSSALRSFPDAAVAPVEAIIQREKLSAHYAPVFGAVLSSLGVDLADAQRLFLYLAGRAVGSAAVRLGLVGAYEAQELQTWLAREIEPVLAGCRDLDPLDIATSAPLIDLFQSTHDRLYSRLFQS